MAADLFAVDTLWFQGLYVFFFIAHDRRTVVHVSVTAHPTPSWVWRQLINATPWGTSPRFLIRDRDRSYGGHFVARARSIGIRTVLTPIATPQANGIAERLVGTFRRECLDYILRYVLREFVRHYNAARPHQTLELDGPEPWTGPQLASARLGSQSSFVVASMRTRVSRSASFVFLGCSPLPSEPHGSPSRCLPCRSCTSFAVVRPRVALPARFDACRGERCSLPRVRVIRAGVPDEWSVPVSLLPGVGDTGETHC